MTAADPSMRPPATRALKVGFITARAGSSRGGEIWTDAGLGRLIDALSAEFGGELRAALSASPEPAALHDHRLQLASTRVAWLPWLPSVAGSAQHTLTCHRVLRKLEQETDVVIVQLPFATPLALLSPGRPRVYHACSDVAALAASSPAYRGPWHWLARSVASGMHTLHQGLARRDDARVVANGAGLLERLGSPRGRAVVSSALSLNDFAQVRRQRAQDAPFRVLFVGYLRPEKGVGTLLEAFARLAEELPSAELVVVGANAVVERGTSGELGAALERLGAAGRVKLLGPRGFGPELFQEFADADVLALPSLSEGTPRVLVEARAFGCTVVASRVGGIPSSVTDQVDGLLVPPADPTALYHALRRLADDSELRARLREQGLARARSCTVEALAKEIADEVRGLASARGAG